MDRTIDPAAAKQVWAQFSELVQQDQPLTFLYWTEDLAGVGPRLRNVEMDVRSKLVNVAKWWIPAPLRR
jgi:peptide/nickel transport system substrate-binding protein